MAKLIGTAGHVDHGKTSLIRALTGIDADRLPEEKERGMTIDIGFAYVDLPPFGRVSIVDVPGHEKFLTNMLVGALGIDVALLCVAADEGVKPQTVEHLQILELLPIDRMVIAITRSDIAEEDVRDLAGEEVRELLGGTRFADAPMVFTSAETRVGIDELRKRLSEALSEPSEDRQGAWYLPIDRSFSVKGHGCVVTGTLAQGHVKVGETAFLEPGHREVRIRAIHSHGEAAEEGEFGRRTALNLGGIKLEEVHRGQMLGAPGALFETTILDAHLQIVGPLKHGQRVRVSIGSEEGIAKAFLSHVDANLVQLRFEQPVACALGQPLIVRRYSPPDILAGGRVVVPQATIRKRADKAAIVHSGSLRDTVVSNLGDSLSGTPTEEVCRRVGRTAQELGGTFEELLGDGAIVGFAGLWFAAPVFAQAKEVFLQGLMEAHKASPNQAMVPRERALQKAGLTWFGKPLDRIIAALAGEGVIEASGTSIRHRDYTVQLAPKQRAFLDRVLEALTQDPVNTPNPHELSKLLFAPIQAIEETLRLGVFAGEILAIAPGIYYTPAQLEGLKSKVRELTAGKPFSAADLRDRLGTTRKYIIPLLEHFDAIQFTVRRGDERKVRE